MTRIPVSIAAALLLPAAAPAMPAGVGFDGTRFFYTNTLRQHDRMPADLRWPRTRQPFVNSFCCPPNVARTVEAHPLVEEARNQVAVRRGPVVYCLESADLPAGVAVSDVAVPADVTWRPRHDAGLLGGVTVLEGAGSAAARPWGRELYREVRPTAAKPVGLGLIPYFAWGNRGPSEMSVWLPLAR